MEGREGGREGMEGREGGREGVERGGGREVRTGGVGG